MKRAVIFAATLILLSGCNPKLLRHYKSIEESKEEPKLELSVFLANPKASDPTPVISGLGERAQAELIRSLASKMPPSSTPEELLAILSKAPSDPPKACSWASKSSATKRLVFTLLGELPVPADRVDKLDITLTLDDADDSDERARFVSWDRFDSVYGKFDIGTAKFTQSGKVSVGKENTDEANLPSAAGSVTKVLTFGAEASNSLEESATYAIRRMSVGGALTSSSARLVQEGGPNVNLFGSSVATLTLSLKPSEDPIGLYAFTLKKQNAALTPAAAEVERCQASFPVSSSPISVIVTGRAWVRSVKDGGGTVSEGDDEISVKPLTLTPKPGRVTLMSSADLKLERYALAYCGRGQEFEDCSRLYIEFNGVQNSRVEQVLVPSLDAAVNLRKWLVEQSGQGRIQAINGLAVGLAAKDDATSVGFSAASLRGLDSRQAGQLRVVRLPDGQ